MKKILPVLIVLFSGFSSVAQDLTFSTATPAFTDAATSHTFDETGDAPRTVSVAATGDTGQFSGSTFPKTSSYGLRSQVNYTTTSQCITWNISFGGVATEDVSFYIRGVDQGALYQGGPELTYQDVVTVTGSLAGGASISPTIGNTSVSSVSGSIITGSGSGGTENNTVTFSSPIDNITVTICSGSNVRTNPNSQDVTIGNLTWKDTPMPVELLYFKGIITQDNLPKLNWGTANEVNFSHFELLMGKNPSELTMVETISTNSSSTYQKTINKELTSTTYFKLKQVDLDGSYSFSQLISISPQETNPFTFKNPVYYGQTLEFNSKLKSIEIIDLSGRTLQKATNINQILFKQKSGLYILNVIEENGKLSRKKIIGY